MIDNYRQVLSYHFFLNFQERRIRYISFIKRLFKKNIYHFTEKPSHYVHIDNPKSLQDYRQIQFNNWCKVKGVFCGSYLPVNPNKLICNGWREHTSAKDDTGLHRTFQRKSTGQIVDYHDKSLTKKKTIADEHYHWWDLFTLDKKLKKPKHLKYLDRYGKMCIPGSKESHLAPLDKNYNFK